ncbi:hypothetical protein BSN85_05170 [Bradyrhizobium brasilense]|nr:hypothetical protein BSN85_05170 [Bradyrhizobium brasilense]
MSFLAAEQKSTTAKFDGPMTCGYGIDAIDVAWLRPRVGRIALNKPRPGDTVVLAEERTTVNGAPAIVGYGWD